MHRLFLFLYRFRAFFLFVLLEVVCFTLIINNNPYQRALFFNSSNTFAATLLNVSNNVTNYLRLRQINENLAEENARLHTQVANLQNNQGEPRVNISAFAVTRDTFTTNNNGPVPADSVRQKQFTFIPARVINNSVRRANNFLTINKGTNAGIEPGMGVISTNGIVGRVKAVSEHFATITSILHTEVFISSMLLRSNTFCSTKWGGISPQEAALLYVPRHIEVREQDTVVTSGYNAIYPRGLMIGTVENTRLNENATFHNITVDLSTEFNTLSYVYVLKNKLKGEKDSLEQQTYSYND